MAETAPGTIIHNIAALDYGVDGVAVHAASNAALLVVAERLDIRLAAGPAPVRLADGTVQAGFTLTNSGTGAEAFVVDLSAGEGGLRPAAILQDGVVLANGMTGMIAPGASIALVAVSTAATPPGAAILIDAHAVTGSGVAGTAYAGLGAGGGDAVVGATGASATLSLATDAGAADAVFEKSQSVAAPDGSARPVRGAVVTYRLVARFGAAARAARIDDPVPDGTRYVPGSLQIDDVALSDADDGDAGGCDGARVTVALGDVPAAAARTIRFQVTIQ